MSAVILVPFAGTYLHFLVFLSAVFWGAAVKIMSYSQKKSRQI